MTELYARHGRRLYAFARAASWWRTWRGGVMPKLRFAPLPGRDPTFGAGLLQLGGCAAGAAR
jgi:hypothetical protein